MKQRISRDDRRRDFSLVEPGKQRRKLLADSRGRISETHQDAALGIKTDERVAVKVDRILKLYISRTRPAGTQCRAPCKERPRRAVNINIDRKRDEHRVRRRGDEIALRVQHTSRRLGHLNARGNHRGSNPQGEGTGTTHDPLLRTATAGEPECGIRVSATPVACLSCLRVYWKSRHLQPLARDSPLDSLVHARYSESANCRVELRASCPRQCSLLSSRAPRWWEPVQTPLRSR